MMNLSGELARRRQAVPAFSGVKGADSSDPTGQICTLNGGNGGIRVTELMGVYIGLFSNIGICLLCYKNNRQQHNWDK
jgi:hypothetical protein